MSMANENHFAGIDEKYSNEYYGLNEEIMRVVSTSSKVTGLNAKTIALLTVVSTLEILNNVLSEANDRLDYLLETQNTNRAE